MYGNCSSASLYAISHLFRCRRRSGDDPPLGCLLKKGHSWDRAYLVSAFVFFCEQKGKKPSKRPASAVQHETLAQGGQVAATRCVPAADLLRSTAPASESCLEQLQGNWVCEAPGAGEPFCRKVIQIKDGKLELRTVDASGRTTLLATGDVTLQGVRAS